MALDEKPSGPPSTTGTLTADKETTIHTDAAAGLETSGFETSRAPSEKNEQNVVAATAESAEAPGSTFLHGFALFRVMVGVVIVMLLAMLDISIISTAIPKITSEFHRLDHVGWYIGAYQLASSTVQPLTGKVYTHFSLKWSFLIFFFVFEVGSAICGAAQSSIMLILGRVVAGLGGSGLMNGVLTIIASTIEVEKRPLYTGLVMGCSQLGIIMGPLVGGALTEHATWRWCFYINLPAGGLGGIFLLLTPIPDQTTKLPVSWAMIKSIFPQFDLTGFALFAPASVMFLLALQFGSQDYGWDSSEVIGLFCGAGATFIVYLFWEYRMGDDAMIPFGLVKIRIVWVSCLQSATLMTAMIVGTNFMPIYFQSVKALSPTMSGVYMLGSIISNLIFVLISGGLIRKFGYYIPWALVASAGTAIGAGLIATWQPNTSLAKQIGYQVLFGFRGLGVQVPMIAVQYILPPKQMAVGNAILVFSMNFFAAIFTIIANTIFNQELVKKMPSFVDGDLAIAAGGSSDAVRALVPSGNARQLYEVLKAYSDAFDSLFYLVVALCCLAFLLSFGMGWIDLRAKEKKEVKEGEA